MSRRLATLKISKYSLLLTIAAACGCANGLNWRPPRLTPPWIQQETASPEHVAGTLFEKKKRMDAAVLAAESGSDAERQKVAKALGEIIRRDPILLMRLHAVKLVAKLPSAASTEALSIASTDPSSDIRIAAVNAWKAMPAELAVGKLQEMIGSDTNVDVRLAATQALGTFPGPRAVNALALALDDPDPALQLRATESLELASGQDLGRDVSAWKSYVAQLPGASVANERIAGRPDGKTLR